MEVRKKRKKRASKKDVYYFFDTQSHVDNKVHFSKLQCGVITDDESGYKQHVTRTQKGKKKKKKKKLVLPSSSENEDEMFSHDDDGRNLLDAAAELANALLENSSIQEALDRDDSHGFESVPKHNSAFPSATYGVKNVSNEPNFKLIFQELDKIDSSETDEVDDIKERIVRLMEKISQLKHPDACSKNLTSVQMFKLKLDFMKTRKVVSEEDTTIDNLVGGHGVNDIEDSVFETAISDFASTNKTEKDSENIDTQTPDIMNVLNKSCDANNGTNVISTNEAAKDVQHSSFIIHDQYRIPSMVTLPSDTTFVVQNFVSYVPVTNSPPAVLGELPEKKAGDEIKSNGTVNSDSLSNGGSDSDSEGENKTDQDMDKNEEKEEDEQEPIANDEIGETDEQSVPNVLENPELDKKERTEENKSEYETDKSEDEMEKNQPKEDEPVSKEDITDEQSAPNLLPNPELDKKEKTKDNKSEDKTDKTDDEMEKNERKEVKPPISNEDITKIGEKDEPLANQGNEPHPEASLDQKQRTEENKTDLEMEKNEQKEEKPTLKEDITEIGENG